MKGDTISRAAALDFVSAMNFCGEISDEAYQKLTVHFENLPSATDTNVGGNLIDRQAALDAIKKLEKPAPTAQHLSAIFDCEDTIKALPSAQPGWIPFGVPMNSGQHYLVTLRQKFEGKETYRVRIMRLHEGHWLYPHHFPEWINDEMEQEVVAWMLLPTPYREGGQE